MSVNINSNANWKVVDFPSWITPSTTIGNEEGNIVFEAKANADEDIRKGTIKIEAVAASVSLDIPVKQEEVVLSVSEDTVLLQPTSDKRTITIISNSQWTAESDRTWCELDKLKGSETEVLTISASGNTGESSVSERTAIVTVKSGNVSRKVIVTQSPDIQIRVEPAVIEFGPVSNLNSSFKVYSNASKWTVESNSTWCRVSPASSSNNGSVSVTVESNTVVNATAREATVFVKSGSVEKKVTIKQTAPLLEVDKEHLAMTHGSGNEYVAVTSNIGWTVRSSASWCTVSPAQGNGNGSITVSVTRNEALSPRKATITITPDESGVSTVTIQLTQAEYVEIRPGEGDNTTPAYSRTNK